MFLPPSGFYLHSSSLLPVDIRPASSFAEGTLPGAVSFPFEKSNATDFVLKIAERFPGSQFGFFDQQGEYADAFSNVSGSFFLEGGYAAYLSWQENYFVAPGKIILLGGKTGTGKTRLLHELAAANEQVIDLEKLAKHKGSAFGNLSEEGQETNDAFRHAIFGLLYSYDRTKTIWAEEEGPFLGRNTIPVSFYKAMLSADMIELLLPEEIRLNLLLKEYGNADAENFLRAIKSLEKRMGRSENHKAISFYQRGDLSACFKLLLQYYDKVYDFRRTNYRSGKSIAADITGLDDAEIVKRLIGMA